MLRGNIREDHLEVKIYNFRVDVLKVWSRYLTLLIQQGKVKDGNYLVDLSSRKYKPLLSIQIT